MIRGWCPAMILPLHPDVRSFSRVEMLTKAEVVYGVLKQSPEVPVALRLIWKCFALFSSYNLTVVAVRTIHPSSTRAATSKLVPCPLPLLSFQKARVCEGQCNGVTNNGPAYLQVSNSSHAVVACAVCRLLLLLRRLLCYHRRASAGTRFRPPRKLYERLRGVGPENIMSFVHSLGLFLLRFGVVPPSPPFSSHSFLLS